MAGATIVTQRMIELRFGSKTFRDMLDDDRTGQADPERVEEVLNEATDTVMGILMSGFTLAQVRDLAAVDSALRGMCCDVAIGIAGRRRPGLLSPDGKTPYTTIQERAERKLMDIAAGKRRIAGEELAGRNAKIGVRVNRDPARHVFAASKGNPTGPGGF